MQLRLTVPGATQEEVQKGLDTAVAVFASEGVDPLTASEGFFALEGWDAAGFPENSPEFTDKDRKAADVWMKAIEAAVAACCASWPPYGPAPETTMDLLLTEEEKAQLYGDDDEDEDDLQFSPERQAEFEAWQERWRKTGKA